MEKINIDYPYLEKIFMELMLNQKFRDDFKNNYPDYADLSKSIDENQPCQECLSGLDSEIRLNKEKYIDFLNDWLETNQLKLDFEDIESRYITTDYMGRVEKVKVSEWADYCKKLAKIRAIYRAFSVFRLNDEFVEVFFL
jgi:hypothetical protein